MTLRVRPEEPGVDADAEVEPAVGPNEDNGVYCAWPDARHRWLTSQLPKSDQPPVRRFQVTLNLEVSADGPGCATVETAYTVLVKELCYPGGRWDIADADDKWLYAFRSGKLAVEARCTRGDVWEGWTVDGAARRPWRSVRGVRLDPGPRDQRYQYAYLLSPVQLTPEAIRLLERGGDGGSPPLIFQEERPKLPDQWFERYRFGEKALLALFSEMLPAALDARKSKAGHPEVTGVAAIPKGKMSARSQESLALRERAMKYLENLGVKTRLNERQVRILEKLRQGTSIAKGLPKNSDAAKALREEWHTLLQIEEVRRAAPSQVDVGAQNARDLPKRFEPYEKHAKKLAATAGTAIEVANFVSALLELKKAKEDQGREGGIRTRSTQAHRCRVVTRALSGSRLGPAVSGRPPKRHPSLASEALRDEEEPRSNLKAETGRFLSAFDAWTSTSASCRRRLSSRVRTSAHRRCANARTCSGACLHFELGSVLHERSAAESRPPDSWPPGPALGVTGIPIPQQRPNGLWSSAGHRRALWLARR
jgi:hypothetical protein